MLVTCFPLETSVTSPDMTKTSFVARVQTVLQLQTARFCAKQNLAAEEKAQGDVLKKSFEKE